MKPTSKKLRPATPSLIFVQKSRHAGGWNQIAEKYGTKRKQRNPTSVVTIMGTKKKPSHWLTSRDGFLYVSHGGR